MADIANAMQGLLQSLQPSPINYTDNTSVQNQQVKQNDINIANQQRQQQLADNAAKLQSQQLGLAMNSPPNSFEHKKAIYNLMTLNPQFAEGGKTILGSMSEDAKNQHVQDVTAFHGYVNSDTPDYQKSYDLAKSIRNIDKVQGKPTTMDDQILDLNTKALSGDTQAQKQLSMLASTNLATVLGPQGYAEYVKLPSDVAATQATTAKTNEETTGLLPSEEYKNYNEADKFKSESLKNFNESANQFDATNTVNPETGKPYVYSKRTGSFINDSDGNVTGSLAYAIDKILPTEANNATATNPNSSATGSGQFISSTWIDQIKKNYPELAKGKTPAQVLALRNDPNLSREVAINYAEDNANILSTKGLPVTTTTLAVAHKLGPSDATRVLQADVNTPLKSLLPSKVLSANPQLANQTVGSYLQGIKNQVGNDIINVNPDPTASVDDQLKTLSPIRRAKVQAYINGSAAVTGRYGTIDNANPDIAMALRIDPTLATAPNRYKGVQAFTDHASPVFNTITAVNTAIPHLLDLVETKLKQGATSGYLGNAIGSLSSAAFQGVVPGVGNRSNLNKEFNVANQTYSTERAKLLQGKAPGEKEIGESLKNIGMDDNIDAAKGAAAESLKTMLARINAIKEQQEGIIGHSLPDSMFIKPDIQQKITKLDQLVHQKSNPTRGDIAYLLAHPDSAIHFNDMFGQYSANKYLGH